MNASAKIQSGFRPSAVGVSPMDSNQALKIDAREGGKGDFKALLNRSGPFTERRAPVAEHRMPSTNSSLREAAGQLVADAFILPLLKTMHDSPLRATSGPFAAGAAEKRFMPLLDQQFADRITQSDQFPLVDSVVKHLSKASRMPPDGRKLIAEFGVDHGLA